MQTAPVDDRSFEHGPPVGRRKPRELVLKDPGETRHAPILLPLGKSQ